MDHDPPPSAGEPPTTPSDTIAFQRAVIDWFDRDGKDYPWRRTNDPYAILVSELMLQQTRIAVVLERRYYQRWMERFPTPEALASAREEDVLKAWEGLGYYNRARNLQRAARDIVLHRGGTFPDTLEGLQSLPGVGRYTAGAVASFAYGQSAPIVDGNVIRLFSRIFADWEPVDSAPMKRAMWERAERLTPETAVRSYNSGIMEIGQRICTRGTPACLICPVSAWCRARSLGNPEEFPIKKSTSRVVPLDEHVLLHTRDDRVFLCPEAGSRRNGLWRLPEIPPEDAAGLPIRLKLVYGITRFRVTLHVYAPKGDSPPPSGSAGRWFDRSDSASLPPLGAPYRRALEDLALL